MIPVGGTRSSQYQRTSSCVRVKTTDRVAGLGILPLRKHNTSYGNTCYPSNKRHYVIHLEGVLDLFSREWTTRRRFRDVPHLNLLCMGYYRQAIRTRFLIRLHPLQSAARCFWVQTAWIIARFRYSFNETYAMYYTLPKFQSVVFVAFADVENIDKAIGGTRSERIRFWRMKLHLIFLINK